MTALFVLWVLFILFLVWVILAPPAAFKLRERGRRGAGPSYPIAFLADHTSLTTANTNRDFSAGTMPTIAAGVAGGKPVSHILVSISATISADTEIGLCSDNGSLKVPREAIPIQAYTPTAREPTRVFLWRLVAPIQLPTTSDLLLARIHTNDTIKVRPASVKFQ